jgi:hypothetical protein
MLLTRNDIDKPSKIPLRNLKTQKNSSNKIFIIDNLDKQENHFKTQTSFNNSI